jgi:glycosyltransferase involved in cell wall biosynthesis
MAEIGKKLVIMPAYNEEHNIGGVIDDLYSVKLDIDIVVIDDGSLDRTAEIAYSKGIKVIRLPFNQGYGAALQTGYLFANKKGYDIVIQMDADGQHDPFFIKDLVDVVEKGEADVALGSRYLTLRNKGRSLTRRLGSLLFSWIITLVTGQKITDPTSGFQVFNRQVISFFANTVFPSDYPDADIIIFLHQAGFRIKEIPVKMYFSANRASMHRGYRIIYYLIKMFLSIIVTMVRKRPNKRGFTQ